MPRIARPRRLLWRAGEKDVTTGATSDLEQATRLARAMVTRYGMSDLIGQVRGEAQSDKEVLGGGSQA